MIRRADLFKKEKELYLEKQRKLEIEQQMNTKGQDAVDVIDKQLSAATSDNVSRAEVIRQLRVRGHPIRLFGESDAEALKRLRRLEIEKPELNEGWKNDFQAALSQVEKEEVMEKIVKGTNVAKEAEKLNVQVQDYETDATWEQILVFKFIYELEFQKSFTYIYLRTAPQTLEKSITRMQIVILYTRLFSTF